MKCQNETCQIINNGIGVASVILILFVSSTIIKGFFQYIKELQTISADKYLDIMCYKDLSLQKTKIHLNCNIAGPCGTKTRIHASEFPVSYFLCTIWASRILFTRVFKPTSKTLCLITFHIAFITAIVIYCFNSISTLLFHTNMTPKTL